MFVIPSAAIGLLVGAIAGGLGRPVRGMIAGFLLSAVVFELVLMPCVSLLGVFGGAGAGQQFLWESLQHAAPKWAWPGRWRAWPGDSRRGRERR
ncbi:MAG: hypothetical protein U0836_19450 [Pirellulales bacterium]